MRFLCLIVLLALSATSDAVDYARDVRPLLKRKCYACHSVLRQKGGLRLDTGKHLLKGGDSGAVVRKGKSGESTLIERVTAEDIDVRMPPEGEGEKLTAKEVAILTKWIDGGAIVPKNESEPRDPKRHWSYRKPIKPTLPKVKHQQWATNPVDLFVARKHQQLGLQPSSPADRRVLIRRVTLDLVGVPPTPGEVQQFVIDKSPNAYEKVVRRLLADPRYGQRWGRHWMDIWRYSDWHGSGPEIRYSQRAIWRWRDWIVNSLNADHGYDQMIQEMLAADEIAPLNDKALPATGFIGRNWYKFDRNVWMRELVEHSARGFLAITLKCARCHDHKYDPIPQEDYYRFRAFFEPHNVRTDPLSTKPPTVMDRGKAVLADGIARVFDEKPNVATYVFTRGDDRYPDKNRRVHPGVPGSLGQLTGPPKSVSLPAAAVVPQLRQVLVEERISKQLTAIGQAKSALDRSKLQLLAAERSDGKKKQAIFAELSKPYFADNFHKANPSWQRISGNWHYKNKRLVQTQSGSFLKMRAKAKNPRNFLMRIRYVALKPYDLHSIGFNFDVGGPAHQSVYTWINPKRKLSGVQAFHRAGGRDYYPRAGQFSCPLKLNKLIKLDIAVRGQLMNVWVDGKLRIVYQMPTPRKDGLFELWNHKAGAEYHEIKVYRLPPEVRLTRSLKQSIPSPLDSPLRLTKQQLVELRQMELDLSQHQLTLAQAQLTRIKAQARAEALKYSPKQNKKEFERLAKGAVKAERQVVWLEARWVHTQAERNYNSNKSAVLKANLAKAKSALDKAAKLKEQASTKYQGLGTAYARTSSGRRTALAKWMTRADNPRTSRVAVNHIWLRLFGNALVESVDDFGMRGKLPSHPELLDWLALYLVDHQWQMKPLHYLLVTSSTYRQASDTRGHAANSKIDSANRYYWRMNHRRLGAEAIRDSVLHISGLLNEEFGGPEIRATMGMTNYRRSMYFWIAPNRQMQFLKLFDVADPDACYRRKSSVVPQQALALSNSQLVTTAGRTLARTIQNQLPTKATQQQFVERAFRHVLCRPPTSVEQKVCQSFLTKHAKLLAQPKLATFPGASRAVAPATDAKKRAQENLILVLLNHNEFVTIR